MEVAMKPIIAELAALSITAAQIATATAAERTVSIVARR
jgi:hypothetical protein